MTVWVILNHFDLKYFSLSVVMREEGKHDFNYINISITPELCNWFERFHFFIKEYFMVLRMTSSVELFHLLQMRMNWWIFWEIISEHELRCILEKITIPQLYSFTIYRRKLENLITLIRSRYLRQKNKSHFNDDRYNSSSTG